MEVEFLIIADSVEAVNGKLYMLGGAWDRYTSAAYPCPIHLGIAVGLSVPWDETNERQAVTVKIIDGDGKEIVPPVTGEVEVGRPPGLRPGAVQRALLAINAGFPLPQPGPYEVVVGIPGGAEKRVQFEGVVGGQGTVRLG